MNSSQQSIMAEARYFLVVFYFFLHVFLYSSYSSASRVGPSSIEWTQINTQHFRIIYDKNQQDLGLYYAQIAETAYSNLSTVFSTLPDVTTIVLADNTDDSNGNATVFPYPLIFAFPVMVGQQDALSESGDWAKELITHELAHVAQLYPYSATGYRIARAVFGSIISPHLLMPNWWKEGMAVEIETQFSNRGRTRSYLQDAQIRSYVTKNKLKDYSLAEANETLITWPYGNRRYFFGSMLMSQIAHEGNLQKKPDAIGQIVLDQSYRLPYNVNNPVETILGSDYPTLYEKTLAQYQANSEKQIADLSQVPVSEMTLLNADLLQSRYVQYSEAQNTVAMIATTDMQTEIQFYKQNSDFTYTPIKLKRLPAEDLGAFDFHPTDAKIVYSKTHQVTLQQNYSDLYVYDMALEKTEKLTVKERARDPIYSPDGQNVLYTHTANGLTELKVINVFSKEIKSVFKVGALFRVNSYTFKNANEIFYTLRNSNGDQILYHLDLTQLTPQEIAAPQQIRFIKYKNNTLYFNSTENEVQNIYSAQVNGKKLKNIRPLTHVMTGVINFDIDEKNQKVFATVIGENGPVVAITPFLAAGIKLPVIKNEILSRYPVKPDQPASIAGATSSDYSVWPYIYPRYWLPFISTNVTGNGVLYQASTSASDPLGYHSYAANLNYDSYSQKTGYLFNYTNAQWDWEFNLSAIQTQQLFGIDTYVRKNYYSASVVPDTISLSENFLFSFGVTNNQTEDMISTNHLGGYVQAMYDSTKQRKNHYYPMTGLSFILKYQNLIDQNNQLNSRFGNYSQGLMSLTSYNHLFLPKDHTLMIKLDGLYTFEDVSTRFGTSNLSLPGGIESLPLFLIRGYQAGQFLGTQMGTLNMEYRFPIYDVLSGSGTTPFYMKYLTAGIVADGLATKGFGYTVNEVYVPMTLSEQIFSAGLELRLSTTLGYILPLNFIYGAYFPLSEKYSKDKAVTALSIQLGGF